MPYKVYKKDGKYCVYKHDEAGKPTGESLGCHDDKGKAMAQMRAVYASENKELANRADVAEKALIDRVLDAVRAQIADVLPKPSPRPNELGMGFTVYKDASGNRRWLAIYSNNFEDREGEIFSEKGFDRYVARLDTGVVPMPRLRAWHVPGSEYGTADWVDRIGHFFVASGTYDDSDAGRAGAAYDEKHWKEYGVSHGLLYRASYKQVVGGRAVYTDWNTFEISPLPYRRAANDLTAFAVDVAQEDALKEAEMDQEKRKHLVEKFGEDYVVRLETLTEQRGKEMETLRAYKDFVHPDGDNAEVEAHKEALDTANEAFKDLLPALVEDAGEAVSASVKAVEAIQQQTKDFEAFKAAMEQRVDALVKDIEAGAPRRSVRASKDLRTRLTDNDPAAKLVEKSVEQERLEGGALAGMFKSSNGNHEG